MQELLTNKTIEKLRYDLVRDGLINYEELSKAEEFAKDSHTNLTQILIGKNMISEEDLLGFIEAKLHIPYVNLDDYTLDKNCIGLISVDDAKKYRIIPLFKIEDVLTIAMTDPLDLFLLKNLIDSLNCKIEPIICSERSILQAIEKYYTGDKPDSHLYSSAEDIKFDWREELTEENPDDFQIQRIIQALLYHSVIEDSREILLEHSSDGLTVKFKNDQDVFDKGNIPVLLVPLFISKLKSMSNLDSSISEMPQLGKLKFFVDPLSIIASVSAFPTIKGERICIKIYKPPLKLDELPLKKDSLDFIKSSLNKSGIMLVCGSGLSGKTSLIYSLLSSMDNAKKNIMTVESMVKYELAGINQCELNEKVGFNFDKAIRFIDFQSPNVIYFEEVFSRENIEFIISLAQSGKLIIAEFLTDNIQLLFKRFKDMGLENIKEQASCIIFIQNKDDIQIIS
ncbi:MAG: ATPase, T2SS/T4P/T4SS family [Candidatus Gastranaerophilales bacterium]|nr:ATPase, T2SS/T4P/T4SS family [Candidatus Gastranaerophilales bacterium]